MLSLVISLLLAFVVGVFAIPGLGTGMGIFLMVLTMVLIQVAVGLLIRRKVRGIQLHLQEIMQQTQAKVNRQLQIFQQRPSGDVRMMQQTLEKMQADAFRESLRAMDAYTPYFKWNMLLKRQVNTMKVQYYYQLKEFDKVDALMKSALMLDPRSLLVKMARMYKRQDAKLDTFFEKKSKRMKNDERALFACAYAWMKLKMEQPDKAVKALVEARKLSDNPTLVENHERLVNGKVKHFSNANFQDQWYSLYLEEPKIKQQRQVQRAR